MDISSTRSGYEQVHRLQRARRSWPRLAWLWLHRLLLPALVGLYVAFLMLAASGGELGQRVLWQHHALLPPPPF